MTEVQLVRGDKNYVIKFTIYDSDNNVLSLENVDSVVFKYKDYANGEVKSITGTVLNPLNGEVGFLITNQFDEVVGEFKAEIEITYKDGKVLTAPNIVLKVIPDIR